MNDNEIHNLSAAELKRRLYLELGVDKPRDELWRALLTLEACLDPEGCEDCRIAKELSFDAHDAGVFIKFTACGLLQALDGALEQAAIGVRDQELKAEGQH